MLSRGLDYSPTTSSRKFARRREHEHRMHRKLRINNRREKKISGLTSSRILNPPRETWDGKDELSRASILTPGNKITRVASRYREHRQGRLWGPLTDSDIHRDVFRFAWYNTRSPSLRHALNTHFTYVIRDTRPDFITSAALCRVAIRYVMSRNRWRWLRWKTGKRTSLEVGLVRSKSCITARAMSGQFSDVSRASPLI